MTSRTHFTTLRVVPAGCNPVEAPEGDIEGRKLMCRFYDFCLDLAVDQNFTGFSCEECTAYVRLTEAELVKQGRRIAQSLRKGS